MEDVKTSGSPEALEASLARMAAHFGPQWPRLNDKPEENPEAALRALWAAAAGAPGSIEKGSRAKLSELNEGQRDQLMLWVRQRLEGKPLAHLLGWQHFMGHEFKAGPGALIPRRETEIVGQAALQVLKELVRERGPVTVMDICTGSGNLAISLALHEPRARVFAADLSEEAVQLARTNVEFHQLQGRVEMRAGDLFGPYADGSLDGQVDLVVCNPPYLSTAKYKVLPTEIGQHEPRAAFDAGSFGLDIINRLTAEAPRFLKPDSWLCFELGLGQGPFIQKRMERNTAYQRVEAVTDAAGEARAIKAKTASAQS